MMSNVGCSTQRLAALAIAAISLTGCATATSEPRTATVCPPVVEYSQELQARAADELDLLPDGSAIAEMLSDYSVMRDQAPACSPLSEKYSYFDVDPTKPLGPPI